MHTSTTPTALPYNFTIGNEETDIPAARQAALDILANYRPHAATLGDAINALRQKEQISPVTDVAPVALPITLNATVCITPFVSAANAPLRYGVVELVREDICYALVLEGVARREWFSFAELTVDKGECVNQTAATA